MKFELTQDEAQIVINALIKEPYMVVVGVIDKIQLQASEQMKTENKKEEEILI